MPANLPPQYFEVEKNFRLAKTTPGKIAALEEMLLGDLDLVAFDLAHFFEGLDVDLLES